MAELTTPHHTRARDIPTTEPLPVEPPGQTAEFPSYPELIGLVTALIPFLVQLPELVNGFVIDWVALPGGVLTMALALWAGWLSRRTLAVFRYQRIAAAVVLFMLGGYHIVRGVGVLGA